VCVYVCTHTCVCVRARIYTHTYIQGKAERAEARIAALDFGGSLIQDMKGGEGAGRCYQKSLYSTRVHLLSGIPSTQVHLLSGILTLKSQHTVTLSHEHSRALTRENFCNRERAGFKYIYFLILGHKVESSTYSRTLPTLTFEDFCIHSSRERAAA
jgi:hypothetical protein